MKSVSRIVIHYTDGTQETIYGNNPLVPQKELPQIPDKYPPIDPLVPIWPERPPTERRCTKCGIKIEGVMGYYCPQTDCPCGLGGVNC